MNILVINPGSTSTKISVYADEEVLLRQNIVHTTEQLSRFKTAEEQFDFRLSVVKDELLKQQAPEHFDAIIARGGLAKPIPGGVYKINELMCEEVQHARRRHVCNLACRIAADLASGMPDCLALIADPGIVDEQDEVATISGSPLMPRHPIWHALNQRAIARRYAAERGVAYEELNLIVCHMGGGISVAAHRKGRAIDANNALDGEGTFSPERAGTLPAADLIRLCFSGRYTEDELLRRISGKAGLAAHLGTNDVREVLRRIEGGDAHAALVLDAMIYRTAKEIAAEGAVLCGEVDAILITGGLAHSDYIMERLRRRIDYLAPIFVYPGEDEMLALAQNALAVLRGEREAKEYV